MPLQALASETPRERSVDENKINIVVIDDSFDTEEKIVSTLRNDGYAARSIRV